MINLYFMNIQFVKPHQIIEQGHTQFEWATNIAHKILLLKFPTHLHIPICSYILTLLYKTNLYFLPLIFISNSLNENVYFHFFFYYLVISNYDFKVSLRRRKVLVAYLWLHWMSIGGGNCLPSGDQYAR